MTTAVATPLSAEDRCDRCGAQAYVRVRLPEDLELLFCAHHGRRYEPTLRPTALAWLDESDRLAGTPDAGR
jgi:hypothetical protein